MSELPDDEPCPTCGRPSPAALRSSIRARSQLITEAHRLGLNTWDAADLISGVRTFPDQQNDTDTNGVDQ